MSFICNQCKKPSPAGTPATKVVSEQRRRQYVNEQGHSSEGWEIVREVSVCAPCAGIKRFTAPAAETQVVDAA